MKKRAIIAALCIAALALASCGKKTQAPQETAPAQETAQSTGENAEAAADGSTAEETAALEQIADNLKLDVIRFWEKEMK